MDVCVCVCVCLVLVCVVDCGFAVNPLGIEGQVEGGLAYGLGGVAFGNIDIVDGEVQQSNFHDYPVMRLPQMPKVEIHILQVLKVVPTAEHRPTPTSTAATPLWLPDNRQRGKLKLKLEF